MSKPTGNPRPSLGMSGVPHDVVAAAAAASNSPGPGDNSQKIKSDSHVQTSKPAGKRRRHRGGRRRRQRRPSFAAPLTLEGQPEDEEHRQHPAHQSPNSQPAEGGGTAATSPIESRQAPGRNLGQLGRNLSESSLDSQELLDHRCVINITGQPRRRQAGVTLGNQLLLIPGVILQTSTYHSDPSRKPFGTEFPAGATATAGVAETAIVGRAS